MKFLILYVLLTVVGADGFVVKFEPRQHYPVLSRDLPTSESYSDFLYWLALYKRKLQRFGFYPIGNGESLWRPGNSETGVDLNIVGNSPENNESAEFVDSTGELINPNNLPAYTVFQENTDQPNGVPTENNNNIGSDMIAEIVVENLEDIPEPDPNSSQIQFNILPAEDASPKDEIYDFVSHDDDLSTESKKSNNFGNVAEIIEEVKSGGSEEEYSDPLDNLVALEAAGILPFVVARNQDDFVPDLLTDLGGSDEDQSAEETLLDILEKASRISNVGSIEPSLGEKSEFNQFSESDNSSVEVQVHQKENTPPADTMENFVVKDSVVPRIEETESVVESVERVEDTKAIESSSSSWRDSPTSGLESPAGIFESLEVEDSKVHGTDETESVVKSVDRVRDTEAKSEILENFNVEESDVHMAEESESVDALDDSVEETRAIVPSAQIFENHDVENSKISVTKFIAEPVGNSDQTKSTENSIPNPVLESTIEIDEKGLVPSEKESSPVPVVSTDDDKTVGLTKESDRLREFSYEIIKNAKVAEAELPKVDKGIENDDLPSEAKNEKAIPASADKVAEVPASNLINTTATNSRNESEIIDATFETVKLDPRINPGNSSSVDSNSDTVSTIADLQTPREGDRNVDALSISPQELLDFMANSEEVDDNKAVPTSDDTSPSVLEPTEKTALSRTTTETTDSVLMSPEELFEFMDNSENESSEDQDAVLATVQQMDPKMLVMVENSQSVDGSSSDSTSKTSQPTSESQRETYDLPTSLTQENLDGPKKSVESIQSTIQVLEDLADETLSLLIPSEEKNYSKNSTDFTIQDNVIDPDNATLEHVKDTLKNDKLSKPTNSLAYIEENTNNDLSSQIIPPYILPSPDVRRTKFTEAEEDELANLIESINRTIEHDTTSWREMLTGSNEPDDISESAPKDDQSNIQLEVLEDVLSMTQDSTESSFVKKRILSASKDFNYSSDNGQMAELEHIEQVKKNLTIPESPNRDTHSDWTIRGTEERVIMSETAQNVLKDEVDVPVGESKSINSELDDVKVDEAISVNPAISPVTSNEDQGRLKDKENTNTEEESEGVSQTSYSQKGDHSLTDTLDGNENSGEYNPLPVGEYILKLNSSTPMKKTEIEPDKAKSILSNHTRGRKYNQYGPFDLLNENEKAFDFFNPNDNADDSEEEEEPERPMRRNIGRSDIPIEDDYPEDYESEHFIHY